MRYQLLSFLVLITAVLFSVPANAQFEELNWYRGFKLSYFELEESDLKKKDTDDPDNVGFLLGFESKFDHGHMGIEAEFTRTFVAGTFDGQESRVDSAGAFLVFRTHGPGSFNNGPYLKIKSGLFNFRTTVGDITDSNTTGALGIGFGFNMQIVRIELDIIAPHKDVGFVSMHVLF